MRAIAWTRYGPPEALELAEVPQPTPKDHELLIRIRATTVTAGDCELRGLRFSLGLRIAVRMLFGLLRPRRQILGQEFAGEVECVGSQVTHFRAGDRVFGTTGFGFGAYAEYICQPERARGRAIATMPNNMSFEEAAAVPTGGLEAIHFLRAAGELANRSVLINGAAGGIGTFAIQLAKYFGADVTAVDAPTKLEPMRSIGADRTIDYTRSDFAEEGRSYDVIFDVVGTTSFSRSLSLLRAGGSYIVANPSFSTVIRRSLGLGRRGKKVLVRASRQSTEDLVFLRDRIEAGKVRSIIDRRYPLSMIAEAHRYVDTGQVVGKVVIRV